MKAENFSNHCALILQKWFETMGQAESRDGSKRPSIGSNAEPKMGALGSAHHPVETRSSTPTPSLLTPKGSGRTKNRRSSLDDKYDSTKEGNNEHIMDN